MDFAPLEAFVLEKMREARVPGLSLALVDGGGLVYSRGFGFRDISAGLPATPRTLYGIGSVTKSFTALAVLQLVEEGRLGLEDPVEKHVPLELRPFGVPVRIHHLLTHSSGLPALAYAEAFIRGVLGMDHHWLPVSSPEDIIAFMRDASGWAVARPGERFFYLNEGYVLLGYIISKLSGVGYEDYVRRRVFEPLGMNRSFFSKAEVEGDGDRATPYIIDREGKHIPSGFPYGVTADGGIISNVLDLSRYLQMYLGRGVFEGKTLLRRELLEAMEQPHVRLPYEVFGGDAYGYGWRVTPGFHGHKLVDHSGSVGVYTAYLGYLPDRGVGVAVCANPSPYPLAHIGRYALSLLIGADPAELPFLRMERVMGRLEGEYQTYRGTMRLTIKKRGDFLYLESRDRYTEQVLPLIPERLEDDHALFYTLVGGVRYTAEFTIKDHGTELIYERYKLVKVS